MPVREIARLAGVSERTLYKYVQRGGWQRRHARAGGTAMAKGAGGRFVPREEAPAPHSGGLKALDPLAGEHATAQANEAQSLSDQAAARALEEAERQHQTERDVRTLNFILSALRDCAYVLKAERALLQRAAAH